MYEAEITSEGSGRIICQRCKESFEPGTKLFYVLCSNSSQPGRHVCAACHEYYLKKPTTRRREDQNQLDPQGSNTHRQTANVVNSDYHCEVLQQVAAAQRGGVSTARPVVAVGSIGIGALHSVMPLPLGSSSSHSARQSTTQSLPPIIRAQQLTSHAPVLNLPAPPNTHSVLPIASLKPAPANPGYQEAHRYYDELRKHFANKAYSGFANAEVVVVKAWMMTCVPGRKNPIRISNIFEAISHIPVHIGIADLKFVLYHALLPHYLKWSKDFPLSIEDCQVRDKLWVELVPKQPDIDAIADNFFQLKGKGKTKVFTSKQGIELSLAISHEKYEAVFEHLTDLDGQKEAFATDPVLPSAQGHDGSSTSKLNPTQGKKRKLSELKASDKMRSQSNNHSRPGPSGSSELPTVNVVKPSIILKPQDVQRALQLQIAPRKKDMRLLFNTTTIELMFFRTPDVSVADLVQNPQLLLEPRSFQPTQLTLSYRPSPSALHGNFKIASVGFTSTNLFNNSDKVSVKQCFYVSPGSSSRKVYEGAKQAELLTMELNCIGWASALMACVYDYMAEQDRDAQIGQPPFDIPQMRYVHSGLAISKGDDRSAFLLEEFIESDKTTGNWFVKYLNNNSAWPRQFSVAGQGLRAEFLSFAQHVQFYKTDGLAFVSDLQGGPTLLTDPQIITDPKLGFIFNEGNTNFDTFLEEHECNQFCKFYRLPVPRKISAGDDVVAQDEGSILQPGSLLSPSSSDDFDLPEHPFKDYKLKTDKDDGLGTALMDISTQ